MNPLKSILLLALLSSGVLASPPLRLHLEHGMRVVWPTTPGNTYQLESASATGGAWSPLGPPLAGDGQSRSFFDPGPWNHRSYRISATTPGTPAAPAIPFNGGFESGTDILPDNWSAAANTPPVRSPLAARSGGFGIRAQLVNSGANAREGLLSQTVNAIEGAVGQDAPTISPSGLGRSLRDPPTSSNTSSSGSTTPAPPSAAPA